MKRISALLLTISIFISFAGVAGEKEKKVLTVKGMHCPSCASMIRKTVRKIEGVEEVNANHESGKVIILFDPAKKPMENVVKAIKRMGYKVIEDDSTVVTARDSLNTKTEK